jgi:hypothetical protein
MATKRQIAANRANAKKARAAAQLELMRIRRVRTQLMAEFDPASADLEQLRRLAVLDRYERFAATRQRRASRKLRDLASRYEAKRTATGSNQRQELKGGGFVRTNPIQVTVLVVSAHFKCASAMR